MMTTTVPCNKVLRDASTLQLKDWGGLYNQHCPYTLTIVTTATIVITAITFTTVTFVTTTSPRVHVSCDAPHAPVLRMVAAGAGLCN